jgi:hypothetical protein
MTISQYQGQNDFNENKGNPSGMNHAMNED